MPMPWNATWPTRASVRTLVSLRAAAGAADGDDHVGAVVVQRGFERDVVADGDAAFGIDGAGNQRRRARDDLARADPHHAHARLAHQHALDAERGQQRHVDPPQPRAGEPQLQPGGGVGVRRQHAFAGRDRRRAPRPCAPRICTASSAATASAPARHRIAGVDARRRGRQRRRRVGAGVERRVGAHRIAVAQRQRGLGMAVRDHRARGERQARAPSTRLPRAARPARPTGRSLPARRRAGSAAQSAGFRNPQPCGELDVIRPGCPVSRDHGQETEPMAESTRSTCVG